MEQHFEIEYLDKDFSHEYNVGTFEACSFMRCNFSEVQLSASKFIDCRFEECNLSSCTTDGTVFRDTSFKNCKLMGILFERCNTFALSMEFDHCILDYSVFESLDLRKSKFKNCSMIEVDLTRVNLSLSILTDCNLVGATFHNTNLSHTDIRDSRDFTISPKHNHLKGMKVSRSQIHGLLLDYHLDIQD